MLSKAADKIRRLSNGETRLRVFQLSSRRIYPVAAIYAYPVRTIHSEYTEKQPVYHLPRMFKYVAWVMALLA
ncbi:MAG TPA: hypothetical protein PLJ62_10285, partial [Thermoflexales bacterium]|nr:hypothetical protein [Thermoflexales bacterium]HRA00576.1 hypothetical protein [Thermoflexales bacterium]